MTSVGCSFTTRALIRRLKLSYSVNQNIKTAKTGFYRCCVTYNRASCHRSARKWLHHNDYLCVCLQSTLTARTALGSLSICEIPQPRLSYTRAYNLYRLHKHVAAVLCLQTKKGVKYIFVCTVCFLTNRRIKGLCTSDRYMKLSMYKHMRLGCADIGYP